MAIYKPNAPFTGISGKLLGSVFVNSRSRQVIRQRPITTKNPTAKQLTRRASFSLVKSLWFTLTNSERKQWVASAATYPRTNSLGTHAPLTGFQLFLFLNRRDASTEFSFSTTPPPLQLTQPPTAWELSNVAVSNPTWIVSLFPHPPFRAWRELWAARSWEAKDVNHLAYWTKIESGIPILPFPVFNLKPPFERSFGPANAGETILIRGRYTLLDPFAKPSKFPSTILQGKTIVSI